MLTADGEVFLDRDGEVTRCSPGNCVVSDDSSDKKCKLLLQRFKIILEYLRAARDQQAFLVPTIWRGGN